MAVRAPKPAPTRLVLEAVLWILNTGAHWDMLVRCYPNYKTVHRRFRLSPRPWIGMDRTLQTVIVSR
jgi:transposase